MTAILFATRNRIVPLFVALMLTLTLLPSPTVAEDQAPTEADAAEVAKSAEVVTTDSPDHEEQPAEKERTDEQPSPKAPVGSETDQEEAVSGAARDDAKPEDSALAERRPDPESSKSDFFERFIDVGAMMQTVFLYKNDRDFDKTRPIYDESGQSVGLVATIFTPRVTFNIGDSFKLFYELELGLNLWSKNNPDQYDPTQNDAFFLKHREVWASGLFLDNQLGFKVGYQHFADPTGLFLNHWMGVASLCFLKHKGEYLWLSFGQVPDTTYEGFVITENNFSHDTFFVGAHKKNPITDWLDINAGLFFLIDNHVPQRNLWLASPSLGADISLGPHKLSINAMVQAGVSDFSIPGEKVKHFAHAVEAHGDFDFGILGLGLNALYLSADDAYHRNDFSGSFFYSGKNKSATILLTENELRDYGDNFDEQMGTKDGGFYNLRSGLVVVDARLEALVGEFFKPAFIAGVCLATQQDNAMGEFYAGTELDLDFGFEWRDIVSFHIIGGMFLPGGAAAALINDINRSRTDNVYMVQSSIQVTY